MSMHPTNTVWVITGANRGIGLGLVKRLIARPSTSVVATVRSKEAASSLDLAMESVTPGDQSSLHIVRLDFSAAIPPDTIRDVFTGSVPTLDLSTSSSATQAIRPPWRPPLRPRRMTSEPALKSTPSFLSFFFRDFSLSIEIYCSSQTDQHFILGWIH
ncbi:hypothetical protein BDW59DRAFT_153919 [Aspergillus cavernicola]|uniref:Uncharacterized protein n=1 Tax=Aspergillus cavernicola TaxID=176166 RepID=A0ABR4HKJ9_9EURO